MSFSYVGKVPSSKSLYNRLLICQNYFPQLTIDGHSNADDVVLMKQALHDLSNGEKTINCGHAGTVFRFLALRVSRLQGKWQLDLSPELKQRPHQELLQVLGQLSVDYEWNDRGLKIHSSGWRLQGDGLHVSMKTSSQFLSGVILNAWNLERDLFVSIQSHLISQGYLQMTVDLVKELGMSVDINGRELVIRAGANVIETQKSVEPDMSSAFALAAVAAVDGDACFQPFPVQSLQPDYAFVEILNSMGVPLKLTSTSLKVSIAQKLNGIRQSLSSCPDLFPSLAVLCALAEGESELYGAPHLKFKESNRIEQVVKLIKPLGRQLKIRDDGIYISGSCRPPQQLDAWEYSPANDHRMAMAAAILVKAGYPLKLLNPEVVNKSFPEFWSAIGGVV